MNKTFIAFAVSAALGLSLSVSAKPVSRLEAPQTSSWLAKNGADNAPGDNRRGQGADNGAGHAKNGADNAPGDNRRGQGADNGAGHAKNGADDGAGDDNGVDGLGHA